MKKIRASVRAARRQLVHDEGCEVSCARDIFFARLTIALLRCRGIIPEGDGGESRGSVDALSEVLGTLPTFVLRAGGHEPVSFALDPDLVDAIDTDPLALGWAYQFWNDSERDAATKGISRRGEGLTGHGEVAVVTQLFTEGYMASFLIERALGGCQNGSAPLGDETGDVLDPACGVGHILLPFLRALRARGEHGEGNGCEALSRLHGADIDEMAVEVCRVLLLAESGVSSPAACKDAWSTVCSNVVHLSSPWGTLDRYDSSPILCRRYRHVVTNPPYIGRRKLNEETREFLDRHYPATSMDLCAAFMERCLELTHDGGTIGLVTVDKWLRLKPYESLRVGGRGFVGLYRAVSLDVVCELGQRAFSSASSIHDGVGVCVLSGTKMPPPEGHAFTFLSVAESPTVHDKVRRLDDLQGRGGTRILQGDLGGDGGSTAFIIRTGLPATLTGSRRTVEVLARVVVGLQTSDDRRFVRYVWSVPPDRSRWLVHSKGGGYDRWFGLNRYLLDWREGQPRFERDPKSGIGVKSWFGEEGWTYTWFANGALGLRQKEVGWSFGRAASSGVFCDDPRCIAFLNSRIGSLLARRLGGKAQLPEGIVRSLPIPETFDGIDPRLVSAAVMLKRALVEHDPREASFSPRRSWDPREQLGIQALLLVVEGLLEQQVCDTLGLAHVERRELDDTMGIPVGWYGRRGATGTDEVWSFIPSVYHDLRSIIEPGLQEMPRRAGGGGDSVEYLHAPQKSSRKGRPLPATSLVESIGRCMDLHPFDVVLDLIGGIETNRVVTSHVVAPVLHARIVALALTELGHQWWGDDAYRDRVTYPELSMGELAERVGASLSTVVRIPERLSQVVLGDSLEGWMVSKMQNIQLRVFSQTPLLAVNAGRSRSTASVRHVWGSDEATSACDRHGSQERCSP